MKVSRKKRRWRRLAAGDRGIVATEFVLIAPILMALFFGILDFGHAFFIKQMVTNAAREGARYGVVYGNPKHTTAQIQAVATNYLTSVGITPTDPPVVSGYPEGTTGQPLQVAVRATKHWWVISFLTGINSTDIYGISVMNNE